ncbi:hypothetical protein Ctob_016476 [Chrysochromulina tobinii]|uniref:Uncharacterized protein n=1 Tax=Chrysochromulina tobinii TaxID=1460289 RepID=A0A0M0LR51_9EUKA|nr:hypothetical protein Ctob_016476 [Chrysochromulina tobinii]|eukprot:KOO53535.1 hypothetical protein Ctob_016476 [Chrysochromulina sp. CCMP291]
MLVRLLRYDWPDGWPDFVLSAALPPVHFEALRSAVMSACSTYTSRSSVSQVLSMIDAFADGAAHSGDDKSLKLGFEIATSLAEEAPSFAASLAASSAPSLAASSAPSSAASLAPSSASASLTTALHEARSASVRLL